MLRKATSNNIRLFDDNYDDSSDEETTEKVSHYQIDKFWSEPSANNSAKKILDNNRLLSFISHAAGIEFLYSHAVTSRYYSLKNTKLKSATISASEMLKDKLKLVIKLSVECALNCIEIYSDRASLVGKKQDDVLRKCQQSAPIIIEKCNDYIKANIDLIIAKFKAYLTNNLDVTNLDFLIKHVINVCLVEWKPFFTSDTAIDANHNWSSLHTAAKDELSIILGKLKIANKQFAKGKLEATSKLADYDADYVSLVKLFNEFLIKSPARGYVSSVAALFFDNAAIRDKIVYCYLDDLYRLYQNTKTRSKLSPTKLNLLKSIYQVSWNNIEIILRHHVATALKKYLTDEFSAMLRPTLGRSCVLASDNPFAFYANLRLSNRSQRRNIKNLTYADIQSDTVSRVWRLIAAADADLDVLESQELLSKSLGRKDLVEGLGNYEKVFEIITDIKYIFNKQNKTINDGTIAGWLRKIFLGKPVTLSLSDLDNNIILHKLQAITFLILGCECARNPGMIIINQMLLDLIINDSSWTFETAFTTSSPLMPMVAEGAVSTARALDAQYRAKMPMPYQYPGYEDDAKIESLINAEAHVVRQWLLIVAKINLQSKIQAKPAGWLLEMIHSNYQQWFGLSFDQVSEKKDLTKGV